MMDADNFYQILGKGTQEEKSDFLQQLPENTMKAAAKSIINSTDPTASLYAFGIMLPSYCQGANCKIGEVLAVSLYRYGKELFISGDHPDLFLMTVAGYAHNYITALINLGKFELAYVFIESELPFWEEYENKPDRLNTQDRASFSDNLKSILVAKINILMQLNHIDEAWELAFNSSRVEGNWASDIELNRLRTNLKRIKSGVGELDKDSDQRRIESNENQEASTNTMLDALKNLMKQTGMDPNLVDNIKKTRNLDPSTRGGFEQFEDILTKGESFLNKNTSEENEITVRQDIRRASGIFVDNQPSEDQILNSFNVLKKSLKAASELKNNILINDAYYGLYLCYSRLNKSSEAADQLINLRKNLESVRKGISNPLERGGVFQTYPYLFYSLVEHLYKAQRHDDMLDAIEASKGRAIIDTLETVSGLNMGDYNIYNIRDRLHPILSKENAHYISYHVDDDDIYISLVTKSGSISSHKIPFGKNLLKRWNDKNLHNPAVWNEQFSKIDIIKELGQLVSFLNPLIEKGVVEENDHLCYSADHLLYLFPFHFLRIGSKSIIDLFTVSRIHNAGHLINLLSKPLTSPESCLTVEVPSQTDLKTPETIRDFGICTELLKLKFKSGYKHLHHSEASREAIMSKCKKNQLIHFATHGFFPRSDNPFSNSGLLIADNGKLPLLYLQDPDYKYIDEGGHLLSPERILNEEYNKVDLDQSHISLQACVSGYAREGIAGDALGVEWAFLQKGAGSMTSTFWNIDLTNANNFYKSFYEEWIDKGSSRAEAHRRSVLKLKNSNQSSNLPGEFYWAGYGLIGDWR